MTTISDLIVRAADPDQTDAERAAALSAAARIAGTANGLPEPPPGWTWRDGRVVPVTSTLVPLKRCARGRWDAVPDDEPYEEPPHTAAPPKRRNAAKPGGLNRKSGDERRDVILSMIARPGGASIDELIDATGMRPLTIKVKVSQMRGDGRTQAVWDRDEQRFFEPRALALPSPA
jgi:hypothetical protein